MACSDDMTSKRTPKSRRSRSCSSRWITSAERAAAADALVAGQIGKGAAFARKDLARILSQILAEVAALGNLGLAPDLLLHPCPEALRQIVDLDAGVVDVELAGDRVPGPLKQRGDGVAERGAAPVADVKGAGRVGGDELDVDLEPGSGVGASVVGSLVDDAAVGQRRADPARARS